MAELADVPRDKLFQVAREAHDTATVIHDTTDKPDMYDFRPLRNNIVWLRLREEKFITLTRWEALKEETVGRAEGFIGRTLERIGEAGRRREMALLSASPTPSIGDRMGDALDRIREWNRPTPPEPAPRTATFFSREEAPGLATPADKPPAQEAHRGRQLARASDQEAPGPTEAGGGAFQVVATREEAQRIASRLPKTQVAHIERIEDARGPTASYAVTTLPAPAEVVRNRAAYQERIDKLEDPAQRARAQELLNSIEKKVKTHTRDRSLEREDSRGAAR